MNNPSDKRAFAELMRRAMSLYGKEPEPGVLALWWDILERYELADISRALSKHAADPDSGQYPPKPADVVRFIQGSASTNALRAWTKVTEAISRVGTWDTVVFDDPIIHAVIADMGGWLKIGAVSNDDAPFIAKEFCKRYQGHEQSPDLMRYPPKLIGRTDAVNNLQGYEAQVPVLIGNVEQAAKVLEHGGGDALQLTQASQTVPEQAQLAAESTSGE